MSKLAKFRSKHGGPPKRNPPIGTDIVEYILPGFAAFAATRVLTRVAALQISKRYPKYAKHAGAIASVGSFAAAWFGAHKVKYLDRFHHPIVVGSGLAALQSLIQLYMPKIGVLLGDPAPAMSAPPQLQMNTATPQQLAAAPIPVGFKPTTAAQWHTYNDAYDSGSYRGKEQAAPPLVPGEDLEGGDVVSDLLDNSDLQLDNSDMGLFS
jgi:hypothetical protein